MGGSLAIACTRCETFCACPPTFSPRCCGCCRPGRQDASGWARCVAGVVVICTNTWERCVGILIQGDNPNLMENCSQPNLKSKTWKLKTNTMLLGNSRVNHMRPSVDNVCNEPRGSQGPIPYLSLRLPKVWSQTSVGESSGGSPSGDSRFPVGVSLRARPMFENVRFCVQMFWCVLLHAKLPNRPVY